MIDADIDSVLRLNDQSVWALSPLDAEGLRIARSKALWPLVCVDPAAGEVAAFAIVYGPGSAYDSINFDWHAVRAADFVYLDRIVVDQRFRRRGIAGLIYDAVEEIARPHGRFVCEVFSEPPNVESLAFHEARGFRAIGHLTQRDGRETVMLEKPL